MLALVLIAAIVAIKHTTARKPISVSVVKVERGPVRDVVSSSTAGEVVPARHATVRTVLGARVLKVRHLRGERVKEGEVIIVLDAADLEARVDQAAATVMAQRAQLGQAEARAQMLKRTADRAHGLAERGAGTSQLAEDSAGQSHEADEAVNAARELVAQAEAAVRVTRVQKSHASLTAPFDGVLVEVHPDPGEELAPGTPVFEIMDDSSIHIEATVDEADVPKLRVGQPATVTLDALPDRPIAGKLSKLGPAVRKDPKGARILPIDVAVIDTKKAEEEGLKPGMSANVEAIVAEKRDVLSLPTNVVVGRGAHRTVFRVEAGHAHVQPIEVGLSNWDRSEILSGLSEGDQIVATLNAKDLEDGAPLTVTPATTKP